MDKGKLRYISIYVNGIVETDVYDSDNNKLGSIQGRTEQNNIKTFNTLTNENIKRK